MPFVIRRGLPEVDALWSELDARLTSGTLTQEEKTLFRKLVKAASQFAADPRHPGLNSHEITALTTRYGRKVFQSYLENNTPGAGRIFWVYGPEQGEITIIAISPHPEHRKSRGYDRVKLSETPSSEPPKDEKPKKGKRKK